MLKTIHPLFLLKCVTWIGRAQPALAGAALLNWDAWSVLTTWGNRKAGAACLHEYGDKDRAGWTRDYNKVR